MGGDDAWQRARYFRFDTIFERQGVAPIVRTHYWDRQTGRYRLEGNAEEGGYRVYLNVKTGKGEAWLGGKKLTDAAKVKRWLDTASDAFARDTMWLLAPFRIFDTSVTLSYEDLGHGPSGAPCDILSIVVSWPPLSDGRLVRESYSMCVDQKSHLVVEWYTDRAFRLSGAHRPGWIWSGWQKRGPILVSIVRTHATEAARTVRFDKITVSETPDDVALTPPK
jgi:hypothetical protein